MCICVCLLHLLKMAELSMARGGRRSNIHFTVPLHTLTDAVCFDLSLANPLLSAGHCPESCLEILPFLHPAHPSPAQQHHMYSMPSALRAGGGGDSLHSLHSLHSAQLTVTDLHVGKLY